MYSKEQKEKEKETDGARPSKKKKINS